MVGRARERPGEPLRLRTSTSTGTAGGAAARHGADAGARRPLRARARGGRARASAATAARSRVRYFDHELPGVAALARRPAARGGRGARGSDELAYHRRRLRPTCPAPPPPTASASPRRHRDKELLASAAGARCWREEPAVAAARRRRVIAAINADPDALRRAARARRTTAWRTGATAGARARLPPLLRHQHPGRPARRGPSRCSRTRHALVLRLVARGRGRRAARRPPRRPARSRGVPRTAARRRRRRPGSWSRRSSSRARRCRATGRSPARPATTSSNRVVGLFVDPAARGAADRRLRRVHRRDRPTTRDRGRAAKQQHRPATSCSAATSTASPACSPTVCERHRRHRDHTRHELRDALRELRRRLPGVPHLRAAAGRAGRRPTDRALHRRGHRARATRARPDVDADAARRSSASCSRCDDRRRPSEPELVACASSS